MSDNLQAIPLGLVGFKDVTYNTIIVDDGNIYTVQNQDQVVIVYDGDILFDTSLLVNNKLFVIKNVSGGDIDVDLGDGELDYKTTVSTFTLADYECIHLLYIDDGTTKAFFILVQFVA